MVDGSDRFVEVGDGLRLRVREYGSGRPLVLLHGIPGSGASWDAAARSLAATHRVLVPDLLGFGKSSRPADRDALWADSQARAVARAIEELAPAGATVVGHDYGGPVALELLRARPELVSALGLAATNAFPDTPIPMPIAAVTWPIVGRLLEPLVFSGLSQRMMLRQGSRSPAAIDPGEWLGDGDQRHATRTIFATALRELAQRYAPLAEALGSIAVPALVVWGDSDPFFSVDQGRRTAAAIPGAELRLYEGCGHFVPAERPDALAEDIARLAAMAPA